MNYIEHWTDFHAKTKFLLPPFDRQIKTSDTTTPFSVLIKSVDGLYLKTEGDVSFTNWQVSCFLFDGTYRQFFGRSWKSPSLQMKQSDNETCKLTPNQNVYLHTSIKDPNILLAMEVSCTITHKNGTVSKVVSGWSYISIFDALGENRNLKPFQRLDIYHGSVRCLFLLDLSSPTKLKSMQGASIIVSVQLHRPLLKIRHLLPENAIIGTNDTIPGIVEEHVESLSDITAVNCFKKPRLLPKLFRQLDKITISLPPSIDKFEEDLREFLQEDQKKESRAVFVVMERRLHVGVHNGWCYVEKPQTVHLEVEGRERQLNGGGVSPSVRRMSIHIHHRQYSAGSAGSAGAPGGQYLVSRNPIQITELVEDPLFAVIFTLEYIVGEKQSFDDRRSSTTFHRANSRSVTIRWALWTPFLIPQSHDVSLSLFGGPTNNPNNTFVYRVAGAQMHDASGVKLTPGELWLTWTDQYNPQDQLPSNTLVSQQYDTDTMLELNQNYSSLSSKPPIQPGTPRKYQAYQSPRQTEQASLSSASPRSVNAQLSVPLTPAQPQYSVLPAQRSQPIYYQPYSPIITVPPAAPMPYMYPVSAPVQSLSGTSIAEVQNVTFNAPVVMVPPHLTSGRTLTRSAYSRLYNAGFAVLNDRHGEAPEVITPHDRIDVDLNLENVDPLLTNEIVLQFLALSRYDIKISNPGEEKVYFSFQFYRFPRVTTERLFMAKALDESQTQNVPYLLQKGSKEGALIDTKPGYEIRYFVDPSFLKQGEHTLFIQHLAQQTLNIDVWDGNSLLLIGSCSIELKYLMRQTQEAIQSTFELDVFSTDYIDDASAIGTQPRPVNVNNILKGQLHLRLANIGHMAEGSIKDPSREAKPCVIFSKIVNSTVCSGGGLNKTLETANKPGNVVRANHLADTNREVASLLFTDKTQKAAAVAMDSVKQRKQARMDALRQTASEPIHPQVILSYKQQQSERMRDLKTIDFYRQQTKRNGILSMLGQALSSEHTIHPSFATVEFFEFVLKNPYNVKQNVKIEYEDVNLKIVTDVREWQSLKHTNNLTSPVEDGLVNKVDDSVACYEVFLQPKEAVNIPFKYQTFRADHSVLTHDASRPQTSPPNVQPVNVHLQPSVTKVIFRGDDGKPIAVLLLNVQPQPCIIHQTFRFYHAENSFLKKSIRLPQFPTTTGRPLTPEESQPVYTVCSDSNVICEAKSVSASEPRDVFIKVACGPTPQIRRFFLAVFTDPFMTMPVQIWQVFVHSLKRLDISAIEGQTTRVSLVLKGTHSSRLVRCFSSDPIQLVTDPSDTFMLAANTTHEISVAVCPLQSTNKTFQLNIVDTESSQLLHCWLVCVITQPPTISRAFEIVVPVGGGKGSNKRISYKNPYSSTRLFRLRCNRSDIVQFKNSHFELAPNTIENIGLRFMPITRAGVMDVLVFINNNDDKNEETFSIKVTYQ